jgi:hypothetical protein
MRQLPMFLKMVIRFYKHWGLLVVTTNDTMGKEREGGRGLVESKVHKRQSTDSRSHLDQVL